jgi:hypothetical protein
VSSADFSPNFQLLTNGDAVISAHRYMLKDSHHYATLLLEAEFERVSVLQTLKLLRERYQLLNDELGKDGLETMALSALRHQVTALESQVKRMYTSGRQANAMSKTKCLRAYSETCAKEVRLWKGNARLKMANLTPTRAKEGLIWHK